MRIGGACKCTLAIRTCIRGIGDIALYTMRAAVCQAVGFACIIIRVIIRVACKNTCLIDTFIIRIGDIALFIMRAAVC